MISQSKVTVVADPATGSVINVSKNPEFGYIKLEQSYTLIDTNQFMRRKKKSTIIHAPIAELQDAGFFAGKELPGSIVVIERLEPFNKKDPERDLKVAGDLGIVCTKDGNPIYRKVIYSPIDNQQDELIPHDNHEQLQKAFERKTSAIQPNNNFDNI
jgi:hypothetical protein